MIPSSLAAHETAGMLPPRFLSTGPPATIHHPERRHSGAAVPKPVCPSPAPALFASTHSLIPFFFNDVIFIMLFI